MPRKKKSNNRKQKPTGVQHQSCKKSENIQNPECPGTSNASSSTNCQNLVTSSRNESKESSKLLNVFSEEIWQLVLGKLKTSKDITSVSNSSLFFRNLLLSQRVTFLFPQVWKVLGMKYERDNNPVYEEDTQSVSLEQYRGESGYSTQISLHSVILKLRHVCRIWSNGVDEFYQNLESNFRMNQDATRAMKHNCKWERCEWRFHDQDGCWTKCYALFTVDDIHKFESNFDLFHLEENKRSPFLSNEICLKVKANQEFTNSLKHVLENYKEHIWYCNMLVDEEGLSLSEIYLGIESLAELLPNLVGLRILHDGYMDCKYEDKAFRQLKQTITRNPFPTLTKLRYLKTESMNVHMFNQILAKNWHIEMLEMEREKLEDCNFFTSKLPNLSQLSIEILSKSEFQKLHNVTWKLNKVYLNFGSCPYIPWSEIFQLVENKWGQTATEVMLGLPSCKTANEIQQHIQEHDSLRLNLQNVKRLRVDLGNFSSIDFILPMKDSLKQLDIAEGYSDLESEIEELWEPTGFQKIVEQNSLIKMYDEEANIWEMLPKLEVLECFDGPLKSSHYPDISTRTEWLKAQRNRNNTVD